MTSVGLAAGGRFPVREIVPYIVVQGSSQEEVAIVNAQTLRQSAAVAALALFLISPVQSRAQGVGNMIPNAAQQAPAALTGGQQSLANKALCSALASQGSDPASASPSVLGSPSVMSAAATSFAGSTKLPLPSATDLLKGYVAQHATDILASCAVSNATSGLTNKVPGTNMMPSMPKY
jgi:hypothetical protein